MVKCGKYGELYSRNFSHFSLQIKQCATIEVAPKGMQTRRISYQMFRWKRVRNSLPFFIHKSRMNQQLD